LQPANGIVFVLDGILIGAGDLRFLAWAMLAAAAAFTPAALGVLWLGLGIGWLWGAYALLQAVRLTVLLARWRTDRWQVLGAGQMV
jgi:Na+-driven multidrug efflux pump